MNPRESILPLVLGALFASIAHLGAAVGYVSVRTAVSAPGQGGKVQKPTTAEPASLVIEELDVPPPRIVGQPATISFSIGNKGKGVAQAFDYRVSVDGSPIDSGHIT